MYVAVVGHHSRRDRAEALARYVKGDLILDEERRGAGWGHRIALERAGGDRLLLLEDDAQPIRGFRARVNEWVERFPEDMISFYLGTGHPMKYMRVVDHRLAWTREDWIELRKLIHGVCFTIPPGGAARALERAQRHPNSPIDFVIGDAWCRASARRVIYPVASLVDHEDGQSLCGTYAAPRKARLLAGPLYGLRGTI